MSDADKKSNRRNLKHGDRVFCIGCYLDWDSNDESWKLVEAEDDIFWDGKHVYEDADGKPYVLINEDEDDDEDI